MDNQASNAILNPIHEEEEHIEEGGDQANNVNVRKRKRPAKRSPHWNDNTAVKVMVGDPPVEVEKAKCNRCNVLLAADSQKNGTTSLKKHTISCLRKHNEAAGQTVLNWQSGASTDGSGSLTTWKFDQTETRLALSHMIILDELPFRFVEHEGFKMFVARACPMFKIPSRKTVREDCVRLFIERKESLKSVFGSKGMGRVSLTTDCWTAVNNTNYICVTAHFISKGWGLHKKIIAFRKIVSHKGDNIGDSVITSLNEWDLKKLLCCTVDNASANDGAVRFIKNKLELSKTNILGGKYLHLRCAAHIMNLVVSDGLDEIGLSVRRVREAVKWITASPARNQQFISCVQLLNIDCGKFLSLDVPTRWNSTYLMLEAAEPYEAALKLYESMNLTFAAELKQKTHMEQPIGPPEVDDWINVRKIMEYLKKFYDLTCLFSGTSYVTIHLFFKEMCDIFDLIKDLETQEDDEISSMARKMMKKVGKYWSEAEEINPNMNKLLYIAALLDPRQKIKHVEKCLKKVYGQNRAAELVQEIRENMNEMFEFYKKNFTQAQTLRTNTSQASFASGSQTFDTQRRSIRRGSCSTMQDSSDEDSEESDNSELTLYFTEKQFKEPKRAANETSCDDTFDILNWWSTHGLRFPILSEIARDVLAIPISTVASESAFSTGGRVLDDFRSSLSPKMVEVLICCEDWLRSSSSFKEVEENMPQEDQEKEFEMIFRSLEPESFNNLDGGTSSTTGDESRV